MFKQLLGVSGIGPKGALGILSAMRPDDLRLAIVSGDVKALSKAPGIGNKTAQRMILDLKDKISPEEILGNLADPRLQRQEIPLSLEWRKQRKRLLWPWYPWGIQKRRLPGQSDRWSLRKGWI